jgi:hypothetical protein
MLIYSSEKEFIGIDEEYLKIFGFSDLETLQKEKEDFADFFVKQPGHVHNFKHVHWIDFIDCAESVEESKVMISIHNKSFAANISITTLYLTQSPSSKSYMIRLNNLRQLSGDTGDLVLLDVVKEEPKIRIEKPVPVKKEVYAQPKVASILLDDLDDEKEVAPIETVEPDYDIPLEIDMDIKEDIAPVSEEVHLPQDDYVFDPKLASDELGLPIDLIEEFIEDFIGQAKEFKSELYSSLRTGDLENVAILSHKLKGVAGNLRVENAYDKLCIINDSKDTNLVKTNLDHFYHIVAQLAGEEVKIVTPVAKVAPISQEIPIESEEIVAPIEIDLDDDDFILEFKDEDDATELIPLDIEIEEEKVEIEEKIELEEEVSREVVVDYSKTVAASEIGLDMETFDELLDDYTQSAFDLLKDMQDSLAVDDMEKCRKKALLLKNMSDSMYIKDLTSDLLCVTKMSDKNSMTIAIENMNAIVKQISK